MFARAPGEPESAERVLHLGKHRITDTETTFEFVVDEAPYEVGIDPYNKLIDRASGDNRKRVTLQ